MNKKEFGKLVAALRKNHIDEDGQFWTQTKLGEETGLGELIIGKIERGERANLDTDALLRLADALHLTSLERKDFFVAAIGVSGSQIASQESQPTRDLDDLFLAAKNIQLPVYISDVYGDIIGANAAIRCLLNVPDTLIHQARKLPIGFNMMYFIFAPETGFRAMMGDRWDMVARQNILFFRRTTLCYRSEKYFRKIFSELQKNRLFKQYWYGSFLEEEDLDSNYLFYNYTHETLGYLSYFGMSSEIVTRYGNLYLNVYIPCNSSTMRIFTTIIKQAGEGVHPYAPWPEKIV